MPPKKRPGRSSRSGAMEERQTPDHTLPSAREPPDNGSVQFISSGPKGKTTSPPTFTSFQVPAGSKSIPCLRSYPPSSSPMSLVFTHGAGGGLSAPAMMNFMHGFASTGSTITCFQGNMNLKGRVAMFATVLDYEKEEAMKKNATMDVAGLAFGGRSMGSRAAVIASHTHESINLLVLASYPLVGPGGDVRDQILLDIRPEVQVLFISGDGDSMCDLAQLAKLRGKMKAKTWMVVVKGADHGMNLKKGTEEVGKETGRIAARWIRERDEGLTEMVLRWDGPSEQVVGAWGDNDAQAGEGQSAPVKGGIKRYFAKTEDKQSSSEAKRKRTMK
ncbi:uncharacterized protein Z518_00062 [Rhinocladiella mackenziei CBS 650.93]|uniref:Rhinocladiella mackenziei CBS 650.93 unplaced genomic scaffold supercont1.1, whole genome shotgun sequence n=1 Tax=Rhinocladiella mackenziei CBS 650.93 TaxID=1442369 RepID=A0A0D2ISN8_9EURO|nr:uncharacterized protein Z518_00062 [Rhinocladiella mackenziei CBS 650.93]KIX08984.1 hypothetical protein Z518_00062 [Rhinocladiella mackenziei CBS 650.93]